jgi:hypothetical protein
LTNRWRDRQTPEAAAQDKPKTEVVPQIGHSFPVQSVALSPARAPLALPREVIIYTRSFWRSLGRSDGCRCY